MVVFLVVDEWLWPMLAPLQCPQGLYSISKSSMSLLLRLVVLQHCLRLRA